MGNVAVGNTLVAGKDAPFEKAVVGESRRTGGFLGSKEAVRLIEDERRRLSMEIHDGAAQWMVSASYRIQAFNRALDRTGVAQARMELSEIRDLIDRSVKELRRVIIDLRPPALGELGLLGALQQNLENFEKDTAIACSLRIEGDPLSLPPVAEIAVYRVIQEALSNVRKHAQATKVDVALRFQGDELCVAIGDNGTGFDIAQVRGKARAAGMVGLLGMKDRAEALGGAIAVESAEGAGTTVTLTLPVSGEPSAVAQKLAI